MQQKTNVKYAIPCAFGSEVYPAGMGDLFFLTFNTTSEKEAYILAKCVCGRKGAKALVIINDAGEVFYL